MRRVVAVTVLAGVGWALHQTTIPEVATPIQVAPVAPGRCPVRGVPLVLKGGVCYGCPAHSTLRRGSGGRYRCYRCPAGAQLVEVNGRYRCLRGGQF